MPYYLLTSGEVGYLTSAHISLSEFPPSALAVFGRESIVLKERRGGDIMEQKPMLGENLGDIMNGVPPIYVRGAIPTYLRAIDEERAHPFFRQLAQTFPNVSFKEMNGEGFLLEVNPVLGKSLDDSLLLDIDFHPAAKNHLRSEGYEDIINSLNSPYRKKRKEARKNLLMVALANYKLEVKIKNGSYYISPARTNSISRSKQDNAKSRDLLRPDDTSEYDDLVIQNLFSSEPVIRR